MKFASLAFAAVMFVIAGTANAATITNGFTFAVASSGGNTSAGDHYHSSTGGDFGNPAGKAEVGSFFSEEVRGLSEYDLTGLSSAMSAFVTFDVYSLGGLFDGANDFLYDGDILIDAYAGNNAENISDYQATSIGSIGSFNTSGLNVGDTLSFNILALFNQAIDDGLTSLGIRLLIDSQPNGGAITFDTFRLTTDDQTSVVPVPAALPLLLTGLAGLGLISRRRKVA